MHYTQEITLAAGLLTALASSSSSIAPTPTFLPSTAILSNLTADPGHDDGDQGSGPYEWSSLIGIIAALAGNVLISLALNIQRYAHIQINNEWELEKLRKELDWKRAQQGQSGAAAVYGAVEDNAQNETFGSERDESTDRAGAGRVPEQPDRLQESLLSDRTMRAENDDEDEGLQHGNRKSYLRSPYWWLGIVLMTVGEIGNFMAYGFAPASIVSPLGVVALISNCVIAPFMLKEKFRSRDFWGVIIAIMGAVVVVLSAKSSEEKIGPHDIWVMITRWEFELYLGLTAALIVGLMWASGKYGSRTILIDVGLVGLFGGYTALSTKGVSSLLSFTWWHVITFPITYLLVFVLVFSALMQIRYINRALQRFDSTQVIPTQFVLFTLSVIIGSAVLYRDFESFTAVRAGKFVGGCLLTFLGVYFITSGRVRADNESSYSVEDEEEAIGLSSGERYQDRADLSPPPTRSRAKDRRRPESRELLDGSLQSPSESLLGRDDIEDIDDNQSTPRAALSAASPSPVGSLAADSLSEPSPGSSSSRPHSLLRNPWADSPEDAWTPPKPEPPVIGRPATPPAQATKAASSTVLFRFPPAPGVDDTGIQPHPSGQEGTLSSGRNNSVPQTPPAKRNSISAVFSPGPLLPTLSAGFSAVVAESLRRGEVSPGKERRTPRRGRKKLLSTTVIDNIHRYRDVEGDGNRGIDAGRWSTDDPWFSMATARLNSADTAPVKTVPSTAGADSGEINRNHSDDITTLSRLRSLSDSWSRSLPWLGGALKKHKASQNGPENTSTNEQTTDANSHLDTTRE